MASLYCDSALLYITHTDTKHPTWFADANHFIESLRGAVSLDEAAGNHHGVVGALLDGRLVQPDRVLWKVKWIP